MNKYPFSVELVEPLPALKEDFDHADAQERGRMLLRALGAEETPDGWRLTDGRHVCDNSIALYATDLNLIAEAEDAMGIDPRIKINRNEGRAWTAEYFHPTWPAWSTIWTSNVQVSEADARVMLLLVCAATKAPPRWEEEV